MPSTIGKCNLFRIKHTTLLEGETFLRNQHKIAFFKQHGHSLVEKKTPIDYKRLAWLNKKKFSIPGCDSQLICDTSTLHIRPFISKKFRNQILSTVHNLSHLGVGCYYETGFIQILLAGLTSVGKLCAKLPTVPKIKSTKTHPFRGC